jgi:hypothetical protein
MPISKLVTDYVGRNHVHPAIGALVPQTPEPVDLKQNERAIESHSQHESA